MQVLLFLEDVLYTLDRSGHGLSQLCLFAFGTLFGPKDRVIPVLCNLGSCIEQLFPTRGVPNKKKHLAYEIVQLMF